MLVPFRLIAGALLILYSKPFEFQEVDFLQNDSILYTLITSNQD